MALRLEKENEKTELYYDFLTLRLFYIDPYLFLFEELKRNYFRDVSEVIRFRGGVNFAINHYIKLLRKYGNV